MKSFLYKSILFLLMLGVLLSWSCFCLSDPAARNTMLGAQITKINKLKELPGERIVIVGGSGCGQGFITSNLCARLKHPVYNMGLHAGLGLIYQMKAVEPLVRKGDMVLLFPEYSNFDGVFCFGEMELLMMVLDIIPEHKSLLTWQHWVRLLPLVPKYGADKLRHLFIPKGKGDTANGFDSYGDSKYPSCLSPTANIPFPVSKPMTRRDFSLAVIPHIKDFISAVEAKGGIVHIFPPAYQNSTFKRQKDYIEKMSEVLDEQNIPLVSSPERYALEDKYFYDTSYHLNLKGRELRSDLVLGDLLQVLGNKK